MVQACDDRQVKSLLLRSCLMFLLLVVVDKKTVTERKNVNFHAVHRRNRPPKPFVYCNAMRLQPTSLQSFSVWRERPLTRTMVKDGRCRWAGSFLLSPTLLGLGSGRFLCRWVTSCLGLLGLRAGFATTLRASAAVVQRATGAPLAGLLVRPAFAALVLLVLLAVPHRSGTGWPPGVNTKQSNAEKVTFFEKNKPPASVKKKK